MSHYTPSPAAGPVGRSDSRRRLCAHGRRKSMCKDCGGASICKHRRQKASCRECGGSIFCQHGRRKSYCKDCGGVSICEHRRVRFTCRDCGGSSFCQHGRHKTICKICHGSGICAHGQRKSICPACGGASICEHKHPARCALGALHSSPALEGRFTFRTHSKCSKQELTQLAAALYTLAHFIRFLRSLSHARRIMDRPRLCAPPRGRPPDATR